MIDSVEILNIYKSFEKLRALTNINFSIKQNTYFGLIGPNGAGKSTLINIMAGLAYANKGTIKIMGNDVRSKWRKARHCLGVVPQELVYDSFFTVREMLRLQSGYFGYGSENYPWVDELIETLDLSEKADVNLQRLSGGMKRRVLIAQALVHKPEVVVLDEPTAGVDVKLRQVLWEFTKQLHQKGHTILLTTHYLEEAENLCQQVAILDKGKVIAIDSTKSLINQYPYRFLTVKTDKNSSDIPESIRKLMISFQNNRMTLKLYNKKDKIGDVLETLTSAGIHIIDLKTSEPSLEDVFMNLTQSKKKHD